MEFERSPLVSAVIVCAIEVHARLGPGLLESAYERCLSHEFHLQGLAVKRQRMLPISYKGIPVDCGYRVDFIVEDGLVIELKTVERILPVHRAQLLTYLRLLDLRQGLLMNFNVALMKQGIRSVMNPYYRRTSNGELAEPEWTDWYHKKVPMT